MIKLTRQEVDLSIKEISRLTEKQRDMLLLMTSFIVERATQSMDLKVYTDEIKPLLTAEEIKVITSLGM